MSTLKHSILNIILEYFLLRGPIFKPPWSQFIECISKLRSGKRLLSAGRHVPLEHGPCPVQQLSTQFAAAWHAWGGPALPHLRPGTISPHASGCLSRWRKVNTIFGIKINLLLKKSDSLPYIYVKASWSVCSRDTRHIKLQEILFFSSSFF
jgi:hypothetical protein